MSNLFMLSAPLEGRRQVEVRERRTKEKEDWARMIRDLVDVHYKVVALPEFQAWQEVWNKRPL